MELKLIKLEKPADMNCILGQSHFIKTVEDVHEAIVQSSPSIKFAVGFCEASGAALIRASGNDAELLELAKQNALRLGCGHAFVVFIKDGFPINVLNALKNVPEVCHIYCASSNEINVVVAESSTGRGVLGVIDGVRPQAIETEADVAQREGNQKDERIAPDICVSRPAAGEFALPKTVVAPPPPADLQLMGALQDKITHHGRAPKEQRRKSRRERRQRDREERRKKEEEKRNTNVEKHDL